MDQGGRNQHGPRLQQALWVFEEMDLNLGTVRVLPATVSQKCIRVTLEDVWPGWELTRMMQSAVLSSWTHHLPASGRALYDHGSCRTAASYTDVGYVSLAIKRALTNRWCT